MMSLLAEGLSAHANGLEQLRSCYGRPSRLPCGNLLYTALALVSIGGEPWSSYCIILGAFHGLPYPFAY